MTVVNYRELADIANSVAGIMTPLGYLRDEACQAMVSQIQAYQAAQHDLDTRNDPRLSPQAYVDDLAVLRERYTGQIDAIEGNAKDKIELIRVAVSKALEQPQDVASQTLYELQIGNGWTRAQLLLAGGKSLIDIAVMAGETGDKGLIAALRQYAGPYLASQNASPQLADLTYKALDAAETPVMSEKQLVARDLRDELESGSSNVAFSAEQARGTISGQHEWTHLKAWQVGRALQVAPAIPGVAGR